MTDPNPNITGKSVSHFRAPVINSDNIMPTSLTNVNYVIAIIASKMMSHCTGTVQMTEESESGIRK